MEYTNVDNVEPNIIDIHAVDDNNDEEHYVWKSCCLRCDRDFVVFISTYLLLMNITIFCFYQLIHLTQCSDQSSYLAVLSIILGVFVDRPKLAV